MAPSFIVMFALPAVVLNAKLPDPSLVAVWSSVVKNVCVTSSTVVVNSVFARRVAVNVLVSEVSAVTLTTADEAVLALG